jgi:REP-associated tyrosine transposase
VSLPRAVIADRTYLITRRCSERRFFLRPGVRTNQAFIYALAEAAQRFGIRVHTVLAMSNHYHVVCSDPQGLYPRFLRRFHQLLAKSMNAHWGRWEAMWASEQSSVVECVEPEDAFRESIYTLANPVAADLVDRSLLWPGVSSLGAQLHGKAITVRRPSWFYDKNGNMPEEVTLVLHRLPGFEQLTEAQWRDKLRRAIAHAEAEATAKRREAGRGVKGRKAVRRDSAFASPKTHTPKRRISPRVAAKNKWRRIEALLRNRAFVDAYRQAMAARLAGREALFPHGTYELTRLGLVRCVPPA